MNLCCVDQTYVLGSCALLALIDTAHRNLYVACTGDARAVAGIWEEQSDGQGYWRVEVLSEDQTGLNPNEIQRQVNLLQLFTHYAEHSQHAI
jgi:pyruvate dehydrogenase phosphatase